MEKFLFIQVAFIAADMLEGKKPARRIVQDSMFMQPHKPTNKVFVEQKPLTSSFIFKQAPKTNIVHSKIVHGGWSFDNPWMFVFCLVLLAACISMAVAICLCTSDKEPVKLKKKGEKEETPDKETPKSEDKKDDGVKGEGEDEENGKKAK